MIYPIWLISCGIQKLTERDSPVLSRAISPGVSGSSYNESKDPLWHNDDVFSVPSNEEEGFKAKY